MSAKTALAAAAAVSALAVTAPAAAQRFRTGIEAVAVDVLVTRDRRVVSGLTASNFVLSDSGVPQRIDGLFFQTLPLNIVVVLDTSESTAGRPLEDLKEAVRAIVGSLRDGDRMALVTFSHRIQLASAWTGDKGALLAAIESAVPTGSTALRDAAFTALMLTERVEGRTLMLVFSDGLDNTSWLSDTRALEAARLADAVVYTVQTSPLPRAFSMVELHAMVLKAPEINGAYFLPALAHETGGDALSVGDRREAGQIFLQILQEFRSRYVLTYSPQGVPADGWHPIDVKLKGASGTIRARRGYFRR